MEAKNSPSLKFCLSWRFGLKAITYHPLENEGFSSTDHFVARIAFAEGDASLVDRLLMFGWGKENRKFDNFGIGTGIGRSAINTNDWQGVTEIYYRWQVTKELVITPDLQVIVGSGLNDADSLHIVAGIRGGLTFYTLSAIV